MAMMDSTQGSDVGRTIDVGQKLAHRAAKRQAKEERITERRWRRKCFWTWPLGHVWRRVGDGYGYEQQRCNACRSTRTKWFD